MVLVGVSELLCDRDLRRVHTPGAVHALVVVNMHCAHLEGEYPIPGARALADAVGALVEAARGAGAVVVHVHAAPPRTDEPRTDEPRTGAGEPSDRCPLLAVSPDDLVVVGVSDDGFDGTPLGPYLDDSGVGSVAICGAPSETCVAATAKAALRRGLRVVVPRDAHSTYDIPASPGTGAAIPAATVARVAEWALGGEVEIVPRSVDLSFERA